MIIGCFPSCVNVVIVGWSLPCVLRSTRPPSWLCPASRGCPAGSLLCFCNSRLPAEFSQQEALGGRLGGRSGEAEYHSPFLWPPTASLTAAASPPCL